MNPLKKIDDELLVIHRSPEIVGYYMGKPIHKTVQLSNKTVYEFVSVAVEVRSGEYSSDFAGEEHALIDEHLLYKASKG